MTKKRLIVALVSIFVTGLLLGGIISHFGLEEETATPKALRCYYPDMGRPSNWKTFDSNGIAMKDCGDGLGKQYNPVTLSQYALANYNYYISTGERQYKEEFLKHADWLVNHEVIIAKGFGVWYYNFEHSRYQCKIPWISAMAQGQAISVLVRAYQLTEDQSYLKSAELAVGAFEHSVDEGGVRFIDEDGNVFYLEYACELHPCVLNGFIFSLLGLHDYYQTTGSQKALSLFDDGIQTLKVRLKDYDTGDSTYYDLIGIVGEASEKYHRLHCQLLYELYFITGDSYFLTYAEKWYSYLQQ